MLKAAAERGWLNEKDAVLEALLCLKRAGSGEGVVGLGGWVGVREGAGGALPKARGERCFVLGVVWG